MEQENKRIKAFTHSSFNDIFKSAKKAIHDFAKLLIALMKVSDWDIDQTANAIENSIVYAKRSHRKYTFEAYVARRIMGIARFFLSLRRHVTAATTACDGHDKYCEHC
ncbi:protein GRAVITROPIC IN THE LIGHT 1 [Forsythia ovata]|uniref:Protein GRAVITROPIC IN THE LIGHT 1 n=1 Tax=Forsythia ovata TaxID=205694 RepID=A0ABD1TAB6_9LAMI